MKINLTAANKQEELILHYLENNASETLADKINNGTPFEKDGKPLINKKTLSGFMKYACDEARKLAEKGASSACVDDATVYGWGIHYFEEESIEGTLYTIDGEEYKPVVVKPKTTKKSTYTPTSAAKPQPQKQQSLQFSLFDKFDENEVKDTKTDALTADTDTNDEESYMPNEEEMQEILAQVHKEEQREKGNAMYQKYMSYQAEHKTAIVAYRLGDFYEVFGENAVTLGNMLSLTITSRDVGLKDRIPMVGFPYHAAENYFAKIVRNHDLYIVENDSEQQFIECIETAVNRHIDEDTGEILCDDLTEDDMRKFDGDIEEPAELFKDNTPSIDNENIAKLKAVLGDTFIVR